MLHTTYDEIPLRAFVIRKNKLHPLKSLAQFPFYPKPEHYQILCATDDDEPAHPLVVLGILGYEPFPYRKHQAINITCVWVERFIVQEDGPVAMLILFLMWQELREHLRHDCDVIHYEVMTPLDEQDASTQKEYSRLWNNSKCLPQLDRFAGPLIPLWECLGFTRNAFYGNSQVEMILDEK